MKNTEVLLILDESTSMESLASEVIASFNGFLGAQMSGAVGDMLVTLVRFANEVSDAPGTLPLFAVPRLTPASYRPDGMTALYDALGLTLRSHRARIERENWADQVIVAILTDGEENASRHLRLDQVRELVDSAQHAGWKFIFLAANQDAHAVAARLGIHPDHVHAFNATQLGIAEAFLRITHTVLALRGPDPS